MKKSQFIISLIFLFFYIFITYADSGVDNYPNIDIPIYDNHFNLIRVFNRPKYTKSLNYNLKAEYPPNSVIDFYDKAFEKKGWSKSKEKSSKNWFTFIDGTEKEKPRVRQYIIFYINENLKIETMVVLKYKKMGNEWGDLHVICQIQPLVDSSKLIKFLTNFQKSDPKNIVNSLK